MNRLFYLISMLFILFSCSKNNINIIQNCSFADVLKISKEQSKPIFLMLGGGDRCTPCNNFIEELQKAKSINRFTDKYIFYKCDVESYGNEYLFYIFLMQSIPNYYILNINQEVVYCNFDDFNADNISQNMERYLDSEEQIEPLLAMQNLSLKTHLIINNPTSKKRDITNALELIRKSININPNFYNIYLQSIIYNRLNEPKKADSCKQLALKYVNTEFDFWAYQDIIENIKNNTSTYLKTKENLAKLTLSKNIIDCGEINYNKNYQYEIEFTNTGKSPLLITHIHTMCDCVKFDWDKQPILPTKSGKIKIYYSARDKGDFTRGVTIRSNASNAYEKFTIKGKTLF